MIVLIILVAVRARNEFFTHRPLTWILLGGFLAMLAGSAYLTHAMRTASTTRVLGGQRSLNQWCVCS